MAFIEIDLARIRRDAFTHFARKGGAIMFWRACITIMPFALMVFSLTSCISTSSFQKWQGPSEFVGQGGISRTVDGITIWQHGTPDRKFKLLGIVDSKVLSDPVAVVLFGDSWSDNALIAEAKRQGGNGIISLSSGIVGGQGFGMMGKRAAVIKFLDDEPILDRWVGVYQTPLNNQVGIVVADLHTSGDHLEVDCIFFNETAGFMGSGRLDGKVSDGKFSMGGLIFDPVQASTSIFVQGEMGSDSMDGQFTQKAHDAEASGIFLLVPAKDLQGLPIKSSDPKGLDFPAANPGSAERAQKDDLSGRNTVDLGVFSPGLLGPGRANVYGPGIHSDATGRPFTWRTDQGQMSFGQVRENAYGLGVGMDQFGRAVMPRPLW